IISNFYVFRPKANLKNIWTDEHTALGIIGLPYQFVFAVTGVFLIVGTTVMTPPVLSFIYKGDTDQMNEDAGYEKKDYPLAMRELETSIDVNDLVEKTTTYWPNFEI